MVVMRRQRKLRVMLFSLVLCLCFPLPALHKISSISTTIFNDSITFGLGENKDDLRSFGMELVYSHGSGWFVQSLMSGITLRGEPGSRFDEIIFQGGYSFHFHLRNESPAMSGDITPLAGFVFAGNWGLEFFQNNVHKILQIDQVDEPYEGNGAREISPLMGMKLTFEYSEPTPWFEVSDLVFSAEIEAVYVPTYMGRFFPSISIEQHTLSTSHFLVGLGYAWIQVYDDWPAHVMVGMHESGVVVFFKGSFGLFSFNYHWYLDRMEGYGGIGFQVPFDDELTWSRSDVLVSLGILLPERVSSVVLRYAIIDDFGVYITNAFKMISLIEERRVRENYSTWLIGGDYEISQWDFGWARPFVAAGLGMSRFLVMGDAEPSSSNINHRERLFSALQFSAEAKVGLRLFDQGEFQYNGSSYGLELSGGMIFSATDGITESGYNLEMTQMWRSYVRLGLTVGSML